MAAYLRQLITCSMAMTAVSALLLSLTPWLSRRYRSRSLYAAWLLVLVGFLVPFRLQVERPIIRVEVPRTVVRTMQQPVFAASQPAGGAEQVRLAAQAEAARSPWQWGTLLGAVWAAGAVAVLTVEAARHIRFLRMVKRWSRPVRDPMVRSQLRAVMRSLGIRRRVRLRLCRAVSSPMLVGLARPMILMPALSLDEEELALVLRHELIHLRRWDIAGRMLLLAARAVHWFNPVIPLVARAVSFACETSCDEQVMRGADRMTRQHYSETIIGVIRQGNGIKTTLSTSYYSGKQGMKHRILSIMQGGRKRMGALVVAGALTAVASGGAIFALSEQTGGDPLPPETEYTSAVQGEESSLGIDLPDGSGIMPDSKAIEAAALPGEAREGDITREEAILIAERALYERFMDAETYGKIALSEKGLDRFIVSAEMYAYEDGARTWEILYDWKADEEPENNRAMVRVPEYMATVDAGDGSLLDAQWMGRTWQLKDEWVQSAYERCVSKYIAALRQAEAERGIAYGLFSVEEKAALTETYYLEPARARRLMIEDSGVDVYPPEDGISEAEMLLFAAQAMLDEYGKDP